MRRTRRAAMKDRRPLCRLAERQIDPAAAQPFVMARLHRRHTVVIQPRRPAPHDGVAMSQWHAQRPIGALASSEEKDRGQTQRNRYDRRVEVALVAILMQREPRTRRVTIDEARIGDEARET